MHNFLTRQLLLLAILLCGTTLSAQSFGLRAGVNATNATVDIGDAEVDTEGQTNLMLGIFANLPVGTGTFSIQPELNYLNRGYNFDSGVSIGNITLRESEQTFSYVDLGVLARLNFGQSDGLGFYVGAGPTVSYAVSGQIRETIGGQENERDVDFDADRLKRSGLQFAGVGGLTLQAGVRFFAELRYNGTLSDLSDNDEIEIRQNSIGINGGIMIPLGQ